MSNELIKYKIKLLNDSLLKLQEFLPDNFDDFQNDNLKILATERCFQLVVDIAIDCNQWLINTNNLNRGDTYKSTFDSIAVMDNFKEISSKLRDSVGLRNAIIHRYETVGIHFEYEQIKAFIPYYSEYLKIISENCL